MWVLILQDFCHLEPYTLMRYYVFMILEVERGFVSLQFFSSLTQDVRAGIRECDLEAKAILQLAGKTLQSEGMDDNINEMRDEKTSDKKE
jgi:hypothetical protein